MPRHEANRFNILLKPTRGGAVMTLTEQHRVFENREDRAIIKEGPGKYALLITGFAEQQLILLSLQRVGIPEQPTDVCVCISELKRVCATGYEFWGTVGGAEEPFHGFISITGRGERGWIESHAAWATRKTILACPNVDDIVPMRRIIDNHRRHIEQELLATNRGWRQIGYAKRQLLESEMPTLAEIQTVSYDFFAVFRDDQGDLTAIYRETIAFNSESLVVKAITVKPTVNEPGLVS